MVLDSSALIAIQMGEPGHVELVQKIRKAVTAVVGAPTLAEAAIVLTARTGGQADLVLQHWVRAFGIEIVPFGPGHFSAAASAFLRYGKGRHPAALNYGDCMSYAIASVSGLPLLYTGRDFAKTDIVPA